jgi:hypothetical protein
VPGCPWVGTLVCWTFNFLSSRHLSQSYVLLVLQLLSLLLFTVLLVAVLVNGQAGLWVRGPCSSLSMGKAAFQWGRQVGLKARILSVASRGL